MKPFSILLPLLALCLFCTSCVDSKTLIKLNRDGSGKIEQTTLPPALLSSGLGALLGGKADAEQPNLLLKEKEWLKHAKALGKGVSLVSLEEYKADGKTGARAVYKFKDINELTLSTDGLSLESLAGVGKEIKIKKSNKAFGFQYTPGALKITIPQPTPKDKTRAKAAASKKNKKENDLKKIFMAQAIADTRIQILLEVEGGVKTTTAAHRNKNQVVLTDLDFKRASKKPEGMKKLESLENVRSVDEGKALLQGIEGIRFEDKPEIDVTF